MGWSVMIFAAGFGTRMKPLTNDRPKPLVEVADAPLIDHALHLTEALPAARTVVNLHYKAEMLDAHLSGRDLYTIVEDPDILDTGGGLRNALPLLDADVVMTLNPDAIWGGLNPLKLLEAAWQPDKMDGLLMCIPPEACLGFDGAGNFIRDTAGRITRGDGLVYGGAQIIKTQLLSQIPQKVFSLNRLWDLMIAQNSLYAVEYGSKWCDVGHPGGIPLAETLIEARHV